MEYISTLSVLRSLYFRVSKSKIETRSRNSKSKLEIRNRSSKFEIEARNFEIETGNLISSFDFEFRCPVSISKFNFEFRNSISSFDIQFRVSMSNFDFDSEGPLHQEQLAIENQTRYVILEIETGNRNSKSKLKNRFRKVQINCFSEKAEVGFELGFKKF